jgi:anti-anti-sigma factor
VNTWGKPSRNSGGAPLTSKYAGPGLWGAALGKGLSDMAQTVFSCSIARHAGDVDLEVIGAMDRSSAGQFRNQLLTLAKEHPASIAIHMDDLALMDSSCVAVLIEAWRFAEEHGIALTVKSPAASIRQVFDVAESGRLLTLRH